MRKVHPTCYYLSASERRSGLFLKLLVIHIVFLCILPSTLHAWQGKVIKVVDGDTIEVRRNRSIEKIRFYGIDAPEKDQPYGRMATNYLKRQIAGKRVDIEAVEKDRYGRTVAIVRLNRKNINQLLLQDGYAWLYARYCKEGFCRKWKRLEEEARLVKRGLWAGHDPVPPWEWRRQGDSLIDRILDFVEDVIRLIRKIMFYVRKILILFGD